MEKLFEYYIESNSLHLKYAKGEPAVKEREFHDYNEFVFFISGKSFFVSNNIQQELSPKSVVIIPKEHFHQFRVESPETYVRCILGFRTTPETTSLISKVMDTIKVISAPDAYITALFEQLIEVVQSKLSDKEKILYINSSIIQLMIYLKLNPFLAISRNINLSPVIIQALSVIEEKYTENLSVKSIAKQLYVSPSTLAHKFSREMNISVYQYITQKRLCVAHELIESGTPVCTAALAGGFNDYSCFYRLYKKYYGNKTAHL